MNATTIMNARWTSRKGFNDKIVYDGLDRYHAQVIEYKPGKVLAVVHKNSKKVNQTIFASVGSAKLWSDTQILGAANPGEEETEWVVVGYSGFGETVFGVYPTKIEAEEAALDARKAGIGVVTRQS